MKKKKSIGTKLCIFILGSMIVLGVVLFLVSYYLYEKNYMKTCNTRLTEVAEMCAGMLDAGELQAYYENGTQPEHLYEDFLQLQNIRNAIPGLKYLYVYKPMEDHFVYVYDTWIQGENPKDFSTFGDTYMYSGWDKENLVPDIKKGRTSSAIHITASQGYGRTMQVWAPVLDSEGKAAFMVEADMLISDVDALIMEYVRVNALVFAACFVLLAILSAFVTRKMVALPLKQLTEYVESYNEGGFHGKEYVRKSNDELFRLASSFGNLNDKVNDYISRLTKVLEEQKRIGAELELAAKIQSSYLPEGKNPFPGQKAFELSASMDPAKEVGGDFYDFFLLDAEHLCMVIGDVSGKGVGAALFMMVTKTMLHSQAKVTESPAELLAAVNDILCENNETEMFASVWVGILDLRTGTVKAANAGHEYPALKKADGEFSLFRKKHGLVIASMPGLRFTEYEFTMEKGDVLYVYTDGVAEATNAENKLYGTDRMLLALNERKEASIEEILAHVLKDINGFVKEAPQFDDITMMGVRYLGEK